MNTSLVKINCSDLKDLMSLPPELTPFSKTANDKYESLKKRITRNSKQEAEYQKYVKKEETLKKYDPDIELSDTAKSLAKEIYIRNKYNKSPLSQGSDYSLGVINGTLSESRSLQLISDVFGEQYKVNKDLVSNAHIKGKLDAYQGRSIYNAKKVIEVKTATNMDNLLAAVIDRDKLKRDYYWQVMGYMSITKAEVAEIYHVLVTYDENLIQESIKRYLNRIRGFGLPASSVEEEINRIRFNMTFDEIEPEERIIKFTVERNEQDIKRIPKKVKAFRKYLKDFENLHLSIND